MVNMLVHYLVIALHYLVKYPKMLLILTTSSTNYSHVPEYTLRT